MDRVYAMFGDAITNVIGAALLTEVGTTAFMMYEAGANYTLNPWKRIKDNCKTCQTGSWLASGICGVFSTGIVAIETLSTGVSAAFGGNLGKDEQMLGAALTALANPLPPFLAAGLSLTATFWFPSDRAISIVLPALASVGFYVYQWRQLQQCK